MKRSIALLAILAVATMASAQRYEGSVGIVVDQRIKFEVKQVFGRRAGQSNVVGLLEFVPNLWVPFTGSYDGRTFRFDGLCYPARTIGNRIEGPGFLAWRR